MKNTKGQISLLVCSLEIGGIERNTLNLANHFIRLGYDVDLLLLNCEGSLLNQLSDDVRIVDLNASRARYALIPLIRYLRREKPTAMLSSMTYINNISIISKIFSNSSSKFVITENSIQSLKNSTRKARSRGKYLYSYTDDIVAVSKSVAEDVADWADIPYHDITIIHNPINIEDIYEKSQENVTHQWFKSNQPVILSVGRLVDTKRFDMLIRAFNTVKDKKEAKLILLGEGEDRQMLTKLVDELSLNDHVYMPGSVANPYPYMKNASVLASSSKVEGFGNVLVESMACGTPVVSTDCPGGPAEILKNGEYGPLVPVGDSEALAEGILSVLEDSPEPEVLRERANDFSVDRICRQYEQVLLSKEGESNEEE